MDDDDVIKDTATFLNKYRHHSRLIIIVGFYLIVLMITFLGFVYGSARVCNQVDGVLDAGFTCHLVTAQPSLPGEGESFSDAKLIDWSTINGSIHS